MSFPIYNRERASAQVKFRCYLFNLNGFLLFSNDVEQEQRKSFSRGENEAQEDDAFYGGIYDLH